MPIPDARRYSADRLPGAQRSISDMMLGTLQHCAFAEQGVDSNACSARHGRDSWPTSTSNIAPSVRHVTDAAWCDVAREVDHSEHKHISSGKRARQTARYAPHDRDCLKKLTRCVAEVRDDGAVLSPPRSKLTYSSGWLNWHAVHLHKSRKAILSFGPEPSATCHG